MQKIYWLLTAAAFSILCSAFLLPPKSIFSLSAENIDGQKVALSQYEGKVLLIVNTASECGLTPQYEDLQKLYETYQAQGLEILAFPSNDFLKQEPANNQQIKAFCASKFKVTFPLFAKIAVKGKNIAPVYQFLTKKSENGLKDAAVSWNFQKFLLNSKGELVEVFSPRTKVSSPELIKAVEKLLKNR